LGFGSFDLILNFGFLEKAGNKNRLLFEFGKCILQIAKQGILCESESTQEPS
jgi:hypothetical protein